MVSASFIVVGTLLSRPWTCKPTVRRQSMKDNKMTQHVMIFHKRMQYMELNWRSLVFVAALQKLDRQMHLREELVVLSMPR